jgi:hypothetical protein
MVSGGGQQPWGPGGGAPGTPPPPGYPPPGYQPQGWQQAPQQPGWQQGPQQPGWQQGPPPGGGGGRNRTPLLVGLGALVVVVVVVLAIVLVGGGKKDTPKPTPPVVALNGEETKTPQAVLDDSRVNLRSTSGVHAAGNVTSGGQTIGLNLDFTGANVGGSLTIGGNNVQIIKIGDVVYLKGDRNFYLSVANGNTAAVNAIGNKWLKASGSDAKDFNEFSLDGFADAFKPDSAGGQLNPGLGRETLDGKPVVVVTQQDGSRLLVANTGKAYPLRLENKGTSEPGRIDFTKFDTPVAIAAPPSGEVLDLSKLG